VWWCIPEIPALRREAGEQSLRPAWAHNEILSPKKKKKKKVLGLTVFVN
jgi:hypothetical protein